LAFGIPASEIGKNGREQFHFLRDANRYDAASYFHNWEMPPRCRMK
jgi:hypothetical protein